MRMVDNTKHETVILKVIGKKIIGAGIGHK